MRVTLLQKWPIILLQGDASCCALQDCGVGEMHCVESTQASTQKQGGKPFSCNACPTPSTGKPCIWLAGQ